MTSPKPDSSESPAKSATWTWKDPAGDTRMRYEPGCWGDVLKGSWALTIARFLSASALVSGDDASTKKTSSPCDEPGLIRYLDPYAGAASYPLVTASADRLKWLASGNFVNAQEPWIDKQRLASTTSLVLDAWTKAGARFDAAVFDLDTERRQTWEQSARVLQADSGDTLLAEEPADWILVDPYDLSDRWAEILDALAKRARRAWILFYLYNRSPRGGGHERNYSSFRRRLESRLPGELTIGRCPADIRLPRAFHEVILSTPQETPDSLRADLVRQAKALTCKLSTTGSTEVHRSTDVHRSRGQRADEDPNQA